MWVKIDDAILDNPKILAAGFVGFSLHVAAITYCGRNLTDGFVPHAKVATLVDLSGIFTNCGNECGLPDLDVKGGAHSPEPYGVVTHLIDVGLWHEVDGGYLIHDYLKYNPSKKQVLCRREKERRKKAQSSPGDSLGDSLGDSVRNPLHPVPVPVPVPVPIPQETLSLASLACASTTEFDEFWKAYPRHVDKQKARKAWAKLRPPPLKAILDALTWQRDLPDWRKEHGGFVPYPATYLNGRRWEDEPPKPQLFGVTARTAGNVEAIKKGLGL